MNIGTVLNALRAAIAADTAWQALTGNAGVMLELPTNGQPTLPFAGWRLQDSTPQLQLEGLDRLRLDVTFYATTREACREMDDYLATHWRIPSGRVAPITSGSYSISGIHRLRSHELPGSVRFEASGAIAFAHVAEYQLRISKSV